MSEANKTEITTEDVTAMIARRCTGHLQRVQKLLNGIRVKIGEPALPESPTIPASKLLIAQGRLILEEMLELLDACGLKIRLKHEVYSLHKEDFTIEPMLNANIDLPHVAKELADLSVVTMGMFLEFGLKDVSILEETDANNLGKLQTGYLDENRKWRKAANHPSPDIRSILIAQGWSPPEVHDEKSKEDASASVPVSN